MSDSNNSGIVKPGVPTGPDKSDENNIRFYWREKLGLIEDNQAKDKEVLERPQTPPAPERK